MVVRGLARCLACGDVPLIRCGSVFSPRAPGGVIALEMRLVGHRDESAPCMVALWLQVAARGSPRWVCLGGIPAGLHEGVKRVFAAGVSAGRLPPVGCALGRVGCGYPGFVLRVASCVGASLDVVSPGAPASLRGGGAVDEAAPV